ncbi:glycosyltransferase family 4 protein [Vagococcus fluvialis]|uniref:glycosyltransferase family 4 protein n=1 Tax=Vagococcus fluvialis TaxID=2738 RepID=UPI003D123300
MVYDKENISYSEKEFKETILLTEAKCKSKKKVLFIVNHDLVIYNFRKELVFELIKQGYEVNILSPPGEKIEKLKKAGCTIHNLEINRRGANIFEEMKLIKRMYSSIKEINPDVVLTFTIKPNIYGAVISKVLKKPCISNVTGIGTSIYSKKLTAKILRQIYVKSLNTCSNIFFQNESNKELFIDAGLKKENIYLLPGSGVNLTEFKTLEFPKNDKVRILYLARIMKDKGINEYIESAKLIKNVKQKENVEFLVAGFIDGDYEDIIKTEENSGVITYLGEIGDVPKLLLTTHCVILPSYHEGMSNVLLEASASGRPVLASNIPGCKEIIDNNKSGFLFEPKNSASLENAILKFLRLTNEEMREYGLNGRVKMENEFDREIVVKKYLIKIEELIK